MSNDIFISYSVRDSERALTLASSLTALGYSVWIDKQGLHGAQTWTEEIVAAINNCKVLLILLSPRSVVSKNVTREMHLAVEKGKKVLPIVLEDVAITPAFQYALSGVQRLSISNEPAIIRSLERIFSGEDGFDEPKEQLVSVVHDPSRKRLAVLPFADLSPARDSDWLAEGLMDELVGTLGKLTELAVSPRSDVMFYKGKQVKARDIASDLGVRYLVEGSVMKLGDSIRITPTLTDTATSNVLWSEKYQGSFSDIFNFQESVATAITEALRLTLTNSEKDVITTRSTQNSEAYELYLKAEQNQRLNERSAYDRAIALYLAAIELDPKFSSAYRSVANTYLAYYRHYSRNPSWLERAEQAAESLERLRGKTSSGLYILSMVARFRGDYPRAIALAQEGIRTNPADSLPYAALGYAYRETGKLAECVSVREQYVALRDDDTNAWISLLVVIRELNDATKLRETALRAVAFFEKYTRKHPDDFGVAIEFSIILLWAGFGERARALAHQLAENDRLDAVATYNLSTVFCALNDLARAMSLLRESVEKGYVDIETIRRDPDLAALRKQPEFEVIVRSLETLPVA